MRVSKKCQYALKAVFQLAVRNSNQPVKIHEIAAAQNIPPRFLEVILNELKHAGFVESRRGNEGGYLLARPAEDLTLAQIIQFVEGPISLAGADNNRNHNGGHFGDHAFGLFWRKIDGAVSRICDETSFAELVESEMAQKARFVPNYAI